ncbi:MAG TPA: ABC transporter substrate-binding protein [Nocardioides sp.]|nr:ABC transporter substrate-binding protein [Nocardioides sp.]
MSKSRLVVLPAVVLAAISLAGCGSKSGTAADGTGAAQLIAAGTLTVCSDVPYPPFEDFDKSAPTGFKGFDVDVISAIAKDLGLNLTIKDSDFTALKSGLAVKTNQCDLVASAMTINPERQAVMDFSDPYFDADQSLLVPDGSPITTLADLNGKKLGVQSGTTGEEYAKAHASGATIVAMPDDGTEFQALKAGQVDALLQDLPVNALHATAGGYAVVETYKTNEAYGFAMKKGNTGLVTEVNDALKKLKDDGDYQKIYDTYFPKK